ncbi:MAG: putative Ig domain-containing protein [Candidatus Korobacteraceae bacterium]
MNSSTGAITGTPQNAGQSNFTVQVTDSETPAVKATAQLSILINPAGGGNLGLLSGNYAFYLNGFNSTTAWTLAGSFISNGNGSITSGMIDYNSITGQPINTAVTGNYSISTTGLNLITLQGQSWGPMTFAFVLDSTANGRMIEYDDTTGQGSRGSGALRKATASAFSLSALNGSWAYGWTGADNIGEREVNVGQFTLAAGNMTNGTCDGNGGGTYYTCTFTGTVSTVNPQTGRATVAAHTNNGSNNSALYVVSTGETVLEGIDSVPQTHNALYAGSELRQSGTFNNGSLNGLMVFYMQTTGGSEDDSSAAIISADGNGNATILVLDSDNGGTITEQGPGQFTYSVGANGAFAVFGAGNNPPAGFLISHNKAFTVSTGSNPDFTWWEPQTGGPFSNASLAGTYAVGSLVPLDYTNADNQILAGSADGAGNFTLNGDDSGSGGLHQTLGALVTYNIASNGRGTDQPPGGEQPGVIYVISPTRAVAMDTHPDARISIIEH